ncbi:MAG: ferredoxin-thioredoxin reductase catalytic domain-containing protein [bacterium]|nr:ferredoxin-thioredoxin reductase catalytic domain-containing protein [bacterium]
MNKVFLYTKYYCPACRKLKTFLTKRRVPFDYVDLDRLGSEKARLHGDEAYKLSGSRAVPVVRVGREVRVGFDPDWLTRTLDLPKGGKEGAFTLEDWQGDPALAPRRAALQLIYQPVVQALGYKFSPDVQEVAFLLEQLVRNEAAHGIPFCPCKFLSGDREQDLKTVCPCIPFHRRHFDSMRRCWCGLYVREDVEDAASLRQVPDGEVTA